MRIGVIGTGRIGSAHAEVVRDHPVVDEVLLADADAGRADKVAAELGVRSASVGEVLGAVDAVVVATATSAHVQLVRGALEAGRPVFCEKPVAPDVRGHLEVIEALRRADVQVQVGFQRRFDAGYAAAREALRSGQLGDLRRAHLVTGDQAPPPAGYLPTSGGIYRDCHIHDFDVLRWVTGHDVVEVYALGANRGAEWFAAAGDVDESAGLLTMDDGTLATFQGSRYNGAGHDIRMELAGTAGSAVVGLSERTPWTNAEPAQDFPAGTPWPNYWVRFRPAYAAELNAFVDVARGERANPCTAADALESFYVAEAATRSRLEHRPVRVAEVRA